MQDSNHLPRTMKATGKGHALQVSADVRAGRSPMRLTGSVSKLEAAVEGDAKKLRRFHMLAYNGGMMRFWWSDVPVVVDIAGLQGTDKSRPIFKDHLPSLIIGHTTKITAKNTIEIDGIVSSTSRVAQEVVDASDNGFPWESSIGVDIDSVEEIEYGANVEVNGQKFDGPLMVVRSGKFMETSFVALGADDDTEAAMLAASAHKSQSNSKKEDTMKKEFKDWLKATGFTDAEITAMEADQTTAKVKTLMAAFEAQGAPKAGADGAGSSLQPDAAAPVVDLAAQRKILAEESRRVAAIRTSCVGHPTIEAEAIEKGWSLEKVELAVLRASRPGSPAIHIGNDSATSAKVLQAAAMQSAGVKVEVGKEFDEKTLDAANSRFHGRLGLGELILEAAWANGFTGRSLRSDLRGALRAAWSTVDIAGILSNVANKSLLTAFNSVEDTWRRVSSIASVRDFKTHTRYRLTGTGAYEEVGNGGEIKHGTLGEETYTQAAKTYALMLAITRTDIINDDLGALSSVPNMLGLAAARKLNLVFWTAFLANSSFFTSGHGNYADGAGTALSIDSLTAAELLFLNQTDGNGDPLGISPSILLVPNALNVTASTLMRSTDVRDTTASTKYPTSNPHAGKFTVERSAYLSNALLTGYSAKAWYLLANPRELPVIETAFLDGQQAPTIEQADADFNTLGIQMRGYHDFGVTKQDYRGGVKMKGEA